MAEKKEKAKKPFTFNPKKIPTSPGCYLYYGADGDLLYIGKAKNLRKRVSSYFQKEHDHPRLQVLVKKIRKIETRVVDSEIEALVLENNLIKEHMPRYNVRLRDDKNFVYLRITKEELPKMEIVRRLIKDGSTYIGPRTATKDFKKIVRFCQKHFRVQMVKESQNYYPHLQQGLLDQDPEDYKKRITVMKQFLQGKTGEVLKELQGRMMTFATEKNFEAAAKTRDLIQSIDVATERQMVEFTDMVDRDCIHFYRLGSRAFVVRLAFRHGKLLHQNEIEVKAPQNQTDEELLEQFIMQFYQHVVGPPKEIFIPVELEDKEAVEIFLSETYFGKASVKILQPQRGDKKKVLKIAQSNAKKFAEKTRLDEFSSSENFATALPELAEVLDLKESPKRMECYDISHFSGRDTVGSMVVFIDGRPAKSEYKRFKIKTLDEGKIDDFASLKEVLTRRFARAVEEEKQEKDEEENLTMKRVETDQEWEKYHAILEAEIFKKYHPEIEYDKERKDHTKKTNHAFVFLKDKKIIGAFRLDEKGKTSIVIRLLAIEGGFQRQENGTKALEMIENWAREEKKKKILLNAQQEVVSFYGKNNYEPDVWKGDSSFENTFPLGKKIEPKNERWPLPDLIVIDGGKGQLSSVMKALKDCHPEPAEGSTSIKKLQIIALAKREEEIFVPNQKEPIQLSLDSPALKLLQRIRDEAHRFAITHNRAIRKKAVVKSVLDEVEGIGPATKKKLLKTFGSVKTIRVATDEELLNIINKKQLENIRHQL